MLDYLHHLSDFQWAKIQVYFGGKKMNLTNLKMIGATTALAVSLASISVASAAIPNKAAPKGGVVNFNIGVEPPTLHPITSTDIPSRDVRSYVLETLAVNDVETYEWKGLIAEKWDISKDGKSFTFYLRKNVVFHDGTPLTAEDVKFSFDAIFEPKYNAAHLIPYYENIAKAEIIDKYTIKFTTKNVYFQNFDSVADLTIFPKHIYSDVEKSKKMNKTLIGTGPYKFEKWDKGQMIVVKKFDKWWGNSADEMKGYYNYSQINFRFYKEENIALERVKKGDLDYYSVTVEAYMKKTEGTPWGKSALKAKVENSAPKSYGFIGFNFRRPLFQDKNVRLALAHLANREEMNKKFRFGMSDLATGPTYNKSEYASSNVKPILFDPKKAQELLSQAGWKDTDNNGILDKMVNGKKEEFKFTLIYPNKDVEKYWTMWKQDLKRAGIELDLKYLEWSSFLKLLDEGNFDTVTLSWGGGSIEWDPKQIWHSASAVEGGSNFIAYKNPEVDKLIDQGREELDKKKRIGYFKQVYEKIAADVPYIFLFNTKYDFYVFSNKVQRPAETFKYEIGVKTWWSVSK